MKISRKMAIFCIAVGLAGNVTAGDFADLAMGGADPGVETLRHEIAGAFKYITLRIRDLRKRLKKDRGRGHVAPLPGQCGFGASPYSHPDNRRR